MHIVYSLTEKSYKSSSWQCPHSVVHATFALSSTPIVSTTVKSEWLHSKILVVKVRLYKLVSTLPLSLFKPNLEDIKGLLRELKHSAILSRPGTLLLLCDLLGPLLLVVFSKAIWPFQKELLSGFVHCTCSALKKYDKSSDELRVLLRYPLWKGWQVSLGIGNLIKDKSTWSVTSSGEGALVATCKGMQHRKWFGFLRTQLSVRYYKLPATWIFFQCRKQSTAH